MKLRNQEIFIEVVFLESFLTDGLIRPQKAHLKAVLKEEAGRHTQVDCQNISMGGSWERKCLQINPSSSS